MNQQRLRHLALLVPLVSVLGVGGLWFFARASMPRWSARVWIPATASDHVILRAQLRAFPSGLNGGAGQKVRAMVRTQRGQQHWFESQADQEGGVGWELTDADRSPSYFVQLWHVAERETSLVEFEWQREQLSPPLTERYAPITVHLTPSGREVQMSVRHGALVFPSPDLLRVSWPTSSIAATPLPNSDTTLEFSGARSSEQSTLRVRNGAEIPVEPTEHVVEVTVRQTDASGEVSVGFGILPLVPGALSARLQEDGTLKVSSPVPRSRAFVAFATKTETLAVLDVTLRQVENANGHVEYVGHVGLPSSVMSRRDTDGVWAVTSSEFDFETEGQLGVPLSRHHAGYAMRFGWGKIFDGDDQQRARANAERSRLRWIAWGGLMLACFTELGLVFAYAQTFRKPIQGYEGTRGFVVVASCITLGYVLLGALLGFV